EIERLRTENERLERKNQEYWGAILQFEKERNAWQMLYRQSSAGHCNAQELMVQRMKQLQILALRLVHQLNQYRAEGQKVAIPAYLKDLPEARLPQQFREAMDAALAEAKALNEVPGEVAA